MTKSFRRTVKQSGYLCPNSRRQTQKKQEEGKKQTEVSPSKIVKSTTTIPPLNVVSSPRNSPPKEIVQNVLVEGAVPREIGIDEKIPEPTKTAQEKEFYTIEEALNIVSTPPREIEKTVKKSLEVDMDILDLRTSPVQIPPPRLAFYRVGEQNHPNNKPILTPKKNKNPSSLWKISQKSKLNDLRITIRRDNPQTTDTPVKQRVFKKWRTTVDTAKLEDPEERKQPRSPPKESPRKRRKSPARSEKRRSRVLRSPNKKKSSRGSRKQSRSLKKVVRREKLHSPRPTQPHARPSTYRTPKRPKLGLVNPLNSLYSAKRVLF